MAEHRKEQRRRQGYAVSRPLMPASYGVAPPHIGGMIAWTALCDRLTSERNYWVATTRPDGRPHVMPVWGIWLDGMFYFSTDAASRKGRNLANNPHASVHLESGDDVVILEGRVEEVTDPALLNRFADMYEAKYQFRPDVNAAASKVYGLRPKIAFAWKEKDFPRTATRWSLKGT
ncbi:MAG: pyridoxamine 5'-phosphate oxidase family protein [Dehalococcoidia bacterium]|nr:pyridoxamine 5'-phosphate oxidase family protein [Dehalococcoidia bacterium]